MNAIEGRFYDRIFQTGVMITMINREDMLELTRRMNVSRNCFSRIAGCYLDSEGFEDGSFNVHFGNLSTADQKKNLALAKRVPFAKTNIQLKELSFPGGPRRQKTLWPLLEGLRQSGLKDDGLLSVFYEVVGEHYKTKEDYGIYFFFGTYDIPVKGTDGAWMEGSEEIYDFLVCVLSPLEREYEMGEPRFGFLYPAFAGRSADPNKIYVFHADPEQPERELLSLII